MSSVSPIRRMDNATLVSLVNNQAQRSLIFVETELSRNIRNATKYYYGEKFGNEVRGKSSVVSRDVGDAIDWIMPSLMRIFGGEGNVVEFEPQDGDDIEQADQATDYINHIYNKRNNGFVITYQFIKDILLNKNGILKVYVDKKITPQADYYDGLDSDTLQAILADEDVEIVEHSVDSEGLHSVKLITKKTEQCYKVEVVPPEEFLIHPMAKNIDDAEFCSHRRRITESDLRAMGYPEQLIGTIGWDQADASFSSQGIFQARHAPDGGASVLNGSLSYTNTTMRKAWYNEAYIRVDYDGDGIAELRRVCTVGNTLLSNDEWDENPFIGATANIISHKFYGLSLYDKLKDIQEIKSSLLRNLLDNMYSINHGRYEVLDGQVNMDDLLNNASHGTVRVKMLGAIKQLDTPPLPMENFQMLSYMDSIKEDRSGVSKTSQGLNADILHSNQASNAVNQVMTAAQQQVELFARVIAETGFKPLFTKLYSLVVKHQDADDIFRLRGKFIPVSPSEWRKKRDVYVCAGLGNHNKDQQLYHLMQMWTITQGLLGSGGMNILTDYDKIYNLLAKISENSGYVDFQKYWRDPASPEGQQGIADFQKAQAQPKADDIKAQAEAQKVQGNLQLDQATAQSDAQMKARELDIREREVAVREKELMLKEEELVIQREQVTVDKYRATTDALLTQSMNKNVGIGDGKISQGAPASNV